MQEIIIVIDNFKVVGITDQAGISHNVGGLNPGTALAMAQQTLIDATTPPTQGA